jgi:hypothetical protein
MKNIGVDLRIFLLFLSDAAFHLPRCVLSLDTGVSRVASALLKLLIHTRYDFLFFRWEQGELKARKVLDDAPKLLSEATPSGHLL